VWGPRRPASWPANLTVLNPWMWPSFGTPWARRINRRLLLGQLRPPIAACGSPVIALTTLPVVADLLGELGVLRWVYYCVDDFSQWPGLDQPAILAMDEQLVRRADALVAVSRTLQDRLARWGRAASLLEHGVDLELWCGTGVTAAPECLDRLERPLVVFWGLIDRRMDVDWLARLAEDLTQGTIVLVGPRSDPDPRVDRLPRVVCCLPVHYEELPGVAREAAVLIMPYADLPVTRAMQPLKLTEYLATGKPVVVRDLPSVHGWADALDRASTAAEFSVAVRRRLAEGLAPGQAAARKRLEQETWAAKARTLERLALVADPSACGGEVRCDGG